MEHKDMDKNLKEGYLFAKHDSRVINSDKYHKIMS